MAFKVLTPSAPAREAFDAIFTRVVLRHGNAFCSAWMHRAKENGAIGARWRFTGARILASDSFRRQKSMPQQRPSQTFFTMRSRQPLMTAKGFSLATLFVTPAASMTSTTSATSL